MRLYRALLRLYPASFRAEYGPELSAAFGARRRDASGLAAVLLLWIDILPDTILTAAQTHWDILRQDLRLAGRTLLRTPGFTLTAIIVAALGIGANTAVFSIADHVLVRPLPFAEASRLVKLWEDQRPRGGYSQLEASPAIYRDWKQASTSFETMAAYRGLSVNMTGSHGSPERVEGASLTADLLPMLGVAPALGRLFTPAEDRDSAPGTLILSDGLWKARFGADPRILGTRLLLDGRPFEVIGVMPPGFAFPRRDARLWTPMQFEPDDFADRDNHYLHVVARLRRGVSVDRARAEMRTIAAQIGRQHPENDRNSVRIDRLRDLVSASARLMLGALVLASIGVLLIACANLANLLLARALVRRKELALRTALGAGRERLVRQLLTESLLLAAGGGLLGVGLALVGTPLLARLVPTSLPIAETPSIDLRVLTLAALLTLFTGIAFGLVPATRACGRLEAAALQEGSRGGVGGRRERLRRTLVVTAVTMSVALSIASGLLIRALWRVQATDPGFRVDGVLTLRTSLPMPKYEVTAHRTRFYTQVMTEIERLPGVTRAAYISFLPIAMRGGVFPVALEGGPQAGEPLRHASLRFVTPGFFDTLGIPIRDGRDVRDGDTVEAARVAVVSASFAKQFWPNEEAIGRRFTVAGSVRTVVGVVGDISVRGLERASEPQIYVPSQQAADGSFVWYAPKDLAVHASGDPAALLPAIRSIIARADPEQPISDVQMLADLVAEDTAPRVAQVRVLGAFTAVALLLAGIGIHGLLSFAVSHRAPEIGVRMAMGAQARDILGMILAEGVALAGVGLVLGVLLAYAAGRGLEALLAGVRPWDLPTFGSVIGVVALMSIAGSLLPAVRALKVDPLTVIRSE